MVRKTYTILAIAVTTSACGGAAETAETDNQQSSNQALVDELANTRLDDALSRRDRFSPLCDSAGYPLPGNVNNKQPGGTSVSEFCNAIGKPVDRPPPNPEPQPKPNPAPACDLKALNAELSNIVLVESAVEQHAHFRCLCDEKGYPLVGNINNKGVAASQFCAALREKNLL